MKPTLLYASPFWPMKSGISEYSESLVRGLQKYFDITLVTGNYTLENKALANAFKVVKYSESTDFSGYDHIIYNFGNNPDYHSYMYDMIKKYPDYVILHDFILYYLTVGYYSAKNMLFSKLYELEGVDGISIVKESLRKNEPRDLLQHKLIADKLPMNREVLSLAKGVLVHSEHTMNLVKKTVPEAKVYKICLVNSYESVTEDRSYLKRKLSLPEDAYIIGAVGYIAHTKRNVLTCEAVKKYNAKHEKKVYYVMIGDGNAADEYLDEYIRKTGFIDNSEFFPSISSCDLIMNLRYPYNGESSATLIQCMDLGKPCAVTDIGWFSELPDDCVVKTKINITADELERLIDRLISSDLSTLKANAASYVKTECAPETIGERIYGYLSGKANAEAEK